MASLSSSDLIDVYKRQTVFNVNPVVYGAVEWNPAWNETTGHVLTCLLYTSFINLKFSIMNKKFLSVILFSALMVGTAGTFTSCKDYDDDIENLDKKTSDLNTQLTTCLLYTSRCV